MFRVGMSALAVVGAALLGVTVSPLHAAPKKSDGFVSLYNGKDLSGWHAKDGKIESWKANGEMLSAVAPGGGWLTTDRKYRDFVLKLEYRIPKGGNSGIGLRYPAEGDPAHVAMELQILDDDGPEYAGLKPGQYNGSIYLQSPASKKAAKPPGEWNRYEIRCKGDEITVRLNGELINRVVMDEMKEGKEGGISLSERYRKNREGYIGVQSHGHQVDFRNIEIKEL